MYLKILNKNNLIDSTLPIATKYQLSNLKSFQIDEDSVFTENYNEQLDSANLRISHLTSELDIESLDRVIIYDNDEVKYLCVDSYACREETLNQGGLDVKYYTYEISLFSETKLLEGMLCPNLAITQLKTNKRSVYDYIFEYMEQYCDRIRVYGNPVTFSKSISIANRVRTKFSSIECPEKQWNAPTLREVLTDLMMVDDCIPIVRNGVLDYIDLTETKNPVTDFNYIEKSQSSSDYISDIRMNLQNVMQTSVDGIDTVVSTVEYLPLVSSDYSVKDNNMIIQTEYPILNIKHLWMCFATGETFNRNNMFFKIDLCNLRDMRENSNSITSLVVEEKEYQTKSIVHSMGLIYPNTTYNYRNTKDISNFYSQKKNFNLYYTRGSNSIGGWYQLQKVALMADQPTYKWIKCLAVNTQLRYGVNIRIIDDLFKESASSGEEHHGIPYYSMFFKIEYETSADSVFQAGKSGNSNKKVIVDNQTNSWVDAYSQGNLEYQKANRLGNKSIMINQRVENAADRIKIGDTYGEYIVYQTQYQVHSSHTEVNAYACKDYILKDYFTGINSKIRTWTNAKDEALIRHDLDKYYCEFSFNQRTEIQSLINTNIANDYLSPLKTTQQTSKIKQAMVKTGYYDSHGVLWDIQDEGKAISLNQITRLVGNSIIHTFGFNDNTTAGKNVDTTVVTRNYIAVGGVDGTTDQYYTTQINENLTDYGGVPLQDVYYVKDSSNFEYGKIKVILTDNIDPTDHTITVPDNLGYFTNHDDPADFFMCILSKPLVADNSYSVKRFEKDYYYIKDNREIPKISVQFEMCSDTRNIYFTKSYLANHVDLLEGTKESLRWYLVPIANFKNGAIDITGTGYSQLVYSLINPPITITGNNIHIDLSTQPTQKSFRDYAICCGTSPTNILFGARNAFLDTSMDIYLNVLKERNKYIYNSNGIIIDVI